MGTPSGFYGSRSCYTSDLLTSSVKYSKLQTTGTGKLLGRTDSIVLIRILELMKIESIPKERMIKSLNINSFQPKLHIIFIPILLHHKLLPLIIIAHLIIKMTKSILSQ